jgi:hypothetical protein
MSDKTRMIIVIPWKIIIGKIKFDDSAKIYWVDDAIIFDNVMTNQGITIPIPNSIGEIEPKPMNIQINKDAVIVIPCDVPVKLLEMYNQFTSNLVRIPESSIII